MGDQNQFPADPIRKLARLSHVECTAVLTRPVWQRSGGEDHTVRVRLRSAWRVGMTNSCAVGVPWLGVLEIFMTSHVLNNIVSLLYFKMSIPPSSICSFLRDGEGVKTLSHAYRNESKQQLITPPPTQKLWVELNPYQTQEKTDLIKAEGERERN